MTHAEKLLWNRLRNKNLHGLKFRRQHPIGPYIADFYCASHKLVIEIDGDLHKYQENEDKLRTQEFMKYAYHVLRFQNHEIEENIENVLAEIISQCYKIDIKNASIHNTR
ncbi:MAG: endonuclease domain-containing protein [Anaerolineales bacterium]|nr:endonuclease domain-containing protein [Anaerolineales bacterium]